MRLRRRRPWTVGDGEADSRDGRLHRILAAAGVPAEELVPVRKVLYAFVSGFLSAARPL
ncbi:hypothetical protein [Nonomuraea sp. NPDC046570]|uniref:hypothetical protein n=1 Tax=Nonomuraea sp. NPDC046570 TaxID=3155255 RepID=UPI0033D9442D